MFHSAILKTMATKETITNDQVTPERLMQLGFAYAPPLIIGAAASNKVFDALATGPKTVEQISTETGSSTRGLRSIMNALTGLGLLAKSQDRAQKERAMRKRLLQGLSRDLRALKASVQAKRLINQRKIDFSIGPKRKETQCRFTAVGSDDIVSRAREHRVCEAEN